MIPLALAAILEDDEEAIQVHEVWALDLSSLNSFFSPSYSNANLLDHQYGWYSNRDLRIDFWNLDYWILSRAGSKLDFIKFEFR